jgi:hypothetical protein
MDELVKIVAGEDQKPSLGNLGVFFLVDEGHILFADIFKTNLVGIFRIIHVHGDQELFRPIYKNSGNLSLIDLEAQLKVLVGFFKVVNHVFVEIHGCLIIKLLKFEYLYLFLSSDFASNVAQVVGAARIHELEVANVVKLVCSDLVRLGDVQIFFHNHLLYVENLERFCVFHDQNRVVIVNPDILDVGYAIFVLVLYNKIVVADLLNNGLAILRVKKLNKVIFLAEDDQEPPVVAEVELDIIQHLVLVTHDKVVDDLDGVQARIHLYHFYGAAFDLLLENFGVFLDLRGLVQEVGVHLEVFI